MSSIEFIYKGLKTTIHCNPDGVMEDIIKKFAIKAQLNPNDIFCLFI